MPLLKPDLPVTILPGIGEKYAKELERMGIRNIADLLRWYPRRYLDVSKSVPVRTMPYGELSAVEVTVEKVQKRRSKRGLAYLDAICSDESGGITIRWFHKTYMENKLVPGSRWIFLGTAKRFKGETVMMNPLTLTGYSIIPIYSQTSTVTSRMLQRWIATVFQQVRVEAISDWERTYSGLPQPVVQKQGLIGYMEALKAVHQPPSMDSLGPARERLAFEEVFWFFLQLKQSAGELAAGQGIKVPYQLEKLKELVTSLPFGLTHGQKRAVWDMVQEMDSGKPFVRLLNGDVGAGKTVVAGLLAAVVAEAGGQTAFLVPTEILARQHQASLQQLLPKTSVAVWTAAKKETITSDIVIGTHALLSETARLPRLTLVVIDEQHRFGVRQRQFLREGTSLTPHVLSMTATPIPRTLALTLYGNLSVSFLKELPKNRLPVITDLIWPQDDDKKRLHERILTEIQSGHQVFVICPLIVEKEKKGEEGENVDNLFTLPGIVPEKEGKLQQKTVIAEAERLQKEHPEYGVISFVHGKMKAQEKATIMEKMRAGEINVLVATSVIEVGIDVPNATVMVIEGAERFGLAQLHQFRGRVGRGQAQSYCFLCPTLRSPAIAERLQVLVDSTSGFDVAEADLALRGPGELAGDVQSGLPDFRMASLTDLEFLQRVKDAVEEYCEKNPDYSMLLSGRSAISGLITLE